VASEELDFLNKILFILHQVLDDENAKEFDLRPLHHRCTPLT
jgi:hypothetical protein